MQVDSLAVMYVNMVGENNSYAKYLVSMTEEMQEEYGREVEDGQMVLLPRIGVVCLAKFSRDGKFRRVEVMNILNGGMIMVGFVDYGTSAVLEAAGLRKIMEKFFSVAGHGTEGRVGWCEAIREGVE